MSDGSPPQAGLSPPGPARVWPRPIPVIGDTTSARARAGDPAGWAFEEAQREALHQIIGARRDIRRFRADPVPDEVLTRLLAAGHAGPSVGHSQPWRFIVVRDAATRDRARIMADRERLRQAAQLEPEAGRRLLDLQLDGISDAPLGLVVCCDRRTAPAGVLGRATFPDTDVWSCACAIQNLWLAARAEGLGLGWVTLFQPRELADLLDVPDGVETLGWLCIGWPDERPPGPGLERAGWSERLPLSAVVMAERWPSQDAPPPPPSRLRGPDQSSVVAARDRGDELLTPPGSLGVLDRAVDRLTMHGIPASFPGRLVLVGSDHPVVVHGVSAYGADVTRLVLEAAVAGSALGVVSAATCGLRATVVDGGVAGGPVPGARPVRPVDGRGDLVQADALSAGDCRWLLDEGRRIGGEAATDGVVALGEVGVGNTTVAAALVAALLGVEPALAVGLGAAADSAMVRNKREVVGRALERARADHGQRLDHPEVAMAALGGAELAILTGVVLGSAAGGAVVVLDGLATTVAALVATRLEPAVATHLIAGQRSREAAHAAVLEELGLEPLFDLRLRAGEGVGACLATGVLRWAVDLRRHAARTAEAGGGPC